MTLSTEFFTLTFALVLLFSFPFLQFAAAVILRNETDKLALLSFKSMITEDPLMVLASWSDSSHYCKWTGVQCGMNIPRVTGLNLTGQKLVGTISPHIGNLSFISLLDLSGNSLQGNIPSELGNFARLQVLNMSNNFLQGQIPGTLSNCSNLRNLALNHNKLAGMVPSELGSFSKLNTLYLGSNNLTGTVPSSLGNLTSLRELDMSYNYLNGEVPNAISQLKKLQTFRLSVNNLSGEFPPSLYNLSSLTFISLSFNNLAGNLRSDIGLALPNLQKIWLAFNFFTGTIPDSFSNATKLQNIDLIRNNFTGKVPLSLANLDLLVLNLGSNRLGRGKPDDLNFVTSLTNCSNLRFLHFGDNQFGGVLPSSIANLSTKLTTLYLQGNFIRGIIPREISNLKSLNLLFMYSNFLNGTIPESFGLVPNLARLILGSNQLTGKIPPSLGNLTRLSALFLFNNSLDGEIPSTLANCHQLIFVWIAQNNLTGIIPREIMSIPSLLSFNVSYNSLTGPLPENIGNLSNLVEIDLSHNKFFGEIPDTIGNCLSLNIISLNENSFQGRIPNLARLNGLNYLDLSSNNLSGKIPGFLADLPSFTYLNLSFNNFEGQLPSSGVFLNASAIDIRENPKLCGGAPLLHLPACLEKAPQRAHRKSRKGSLKLILIVVFTTIFAALAIFLLIVCWIRKRPNKKPISSSSASFKFFPTITYEELQHATNKFSSENIIGSGSFGTVYKGTLHSDGTTVAVKVLNLSTRGASKSFLAECQALTNIRHKNLLKVITTCSSNDLRGEEFKALVYPYMPNGSLDKWLHPEEEAPQWQKLSILQRIDIVVDVAAALNYLHHHCQTPVIHCDLKPQNVLLDSDMAAHVGDFGLARLVRRSSTEEYANPFSSLGIKGTIGYAAPEYGMGANICILGDVYSFGILLLEIFTGKRPTSSLFSENLSLHHFVKLALPEKVYKILDNSALSDEVTGISETWEESWSRLTSEQCKGLTYALQIGVACSSDSPKDRMSMSKAYQELLTIRGAFPANGMELKQNPSLSNRISGYIESV